MKKVVGASATALMVAALLTGCDNKCGIKTECEPCDPCATVAPAKTSAKVARITTVQTETMSPCIAVMPFQCVEECPESGFIVAESLADALSTIDGCTVYSPEVVTTRVKFKDGEAIDPVEVGRKLNAPYILTGRVTEYVENEDNGQTSVGVTARLIDSRTGQEIWTAKQYEEYMNKALGNWSVAVSSDLAQAINLGVKETKVVQTVTVPPAVARIPDVTEVEVEVATDLDIPIDMMMSDPYASTSDMDVIAFSSDTDVSDFGIAQAPAPMMPPPPAPAPKLSAPVTVDEYGIDTGSPVTARYGSPTLPTNEVGRILDRFEDPNPPRLITPPAPKAEPKETVAAAPAAKPAEKEADVSVSPWRDWEGTADIAIDVATPAPAPTLPDKVEPQPEAAEPLGQGLASSSQVVPQAGTADLLQYHYTGANPFADGPGKKQDKAAEPARTFVPQSMAMTGVMAGATWDAATDETELAEKPQSGESMFMPIPPLCNDSLKPPELPSDFLAPAPFEPMTFTDTQAMAAPELPSQESGETMYMPEPLQMEPTSKAEPREVKASEDGTYKVTISAEQFLQGDEFDFFGSLSDKLGDMDDIEG